MQKYEIVVHFSKLYSAWHAAVRSPVTDTYLFTVEDTPYAALMKLSEVLKSFEEKTN